MIRVHTELPVTGPLALESFTQFDELQLLRAIHRPLLDRIGDYGLATSTFDDTRLSLVVNDDARWSNGTRVKASEVAAALTKALGRFPGLGSLLGLGEPRVVEASRRLDLPTPAAPLVAQILEDLRFAPHLRADGVRDFTGAFAPEADGRLVPRTKRGGPALVPTTITSAEEAVSSWDQGDIVATCPAMFDVARAAGDRDDIVRSESTLVARLLMNPSAVDAELWTPAFRAALARVVEVPSEAADVLTPMNAPSEHAAELARPTLRAPLRLTFADHWPNHHIVDAIVRGFAALGVTGIIAEPTTLSALIPRIGTGDFALALSLQSETWGGHSFAVGRAAAIARAHEALGATLRAHVLDVAWGSSARELDALLFDLLPTLPLFRFRSAYLARGPLRTAGLADGSLLRLERLTTAG